jgi:hypothetical protein
MVLRRLWMAALAMAATAGLAPTVGAQSGRLTLVYACDLQSEPCKTWESQWEPMFRASPASQKVTLRKVNAPTARALLQPASWPKDLRWVLDTFLMSQEGTQDGYDTPRFFLLQDNQISFASVGNNGWREFMWPTILDMTNTRP